MDVQKYEILLKVLETGSLSRAAVALDYTQSGITHAIHALERAWNVQLFHRTHTGVELTADGQRLIPYAREICNGERRLQEELHAIHGLEVGRIRIGSFTSVSSHLLPEVIRRFEEQHPGIEFEVRQGNYTEIEQWLLEGAVDIAFLTEPLHPKLTGTPLFEDRMMAVLPPSHPLAACDRIELSQLAGEPLILLDVSARNRIENLFRSQQLVPNIRYRVRDGYMTTAMVERGLGISIMYELLLSHSPHRLAVRELVPLSRRQIVVAHRPAGGGVSRLVKAFLRLLGEMTPALVGGTDIE